MPLPALVPVSPVRASSPSPAFSSPSFTPVQNALMVDGSAIVALKPLFGGGWRTCASALGVANANAPKNSGPSQNLCSMFISPFRELADTLEDGATHVPNGRGVM